jgi:hypothetical protein
MFLILMLRAWRFFIQRKLVLNAGKDLGHGHDRCGMRFWLFRDILVLGAQP